MSQGFAESDRRPDSSGEYASPATAPGASSARPTTLFDTVVEATESAGVETPQQREARSRLAAFLDAPDEAAALRHWIALQGDAVDRGRLDRGQVARLLNRDVARIDALLGRQLDAILHHPRFQRIEASWRGLRYLVDQADGAEGVKIRVLSVTWHELARDFERAIEFDQSQLFRKVYSEEFGTPGGEPFNVLLGDYAVWPRPCKEHPIDDIEVLTSISGVAAAAFAPFVAGVDPSMLGLNTFNSLEQTLNLEATFDQLEYLKWRAFRETEDARFVGLTLPNVLMRLPHDDDGSRTDGFVYREDVSGPDHGKYLWGNAAFGFGAVLVRAYADAGWLADIRGVERGVERGGLVTGLPVHSFATDQTGVATKCSTDVVITDHQEQELSDLGFIPLCHCADTDHSAFYATLSTQKPKKYDDPAATLNSRVSSMLQYTLCVSLFAHYLKVAARDKIGLFTEASECQDYLHLWLQQYVTSDSEASQSVKAELPLREANVQVREHPEKPGTYLCIAHLWPHFELDELATTLRVTTELTQPQGT